MHPIYVPLDNPTPVNRKDIAAAVQIANGTATIEDCNYFMATSSYPAITPAVQGGGESDGDFLTRQLGLIKGDAVNFIAATLMEFVK